MPDPRENLLGVRLAPEWYDQYPVRVHTPDDDIWRDVPTEEFTEHYGVPADIGVEIEDWDREFQDGFRPDDPAESGFDDEETAARWEARGITVARRLAGALAGIPVEVALLVGHLVVEPDPPSTGPR
jgi:hypothetical protein